MARGPDGRFIKKESAPLHLQPGQIVPAPELESDTADWSFVTLILLASCAAAAIVLALKYL